MRKTSRTFLKVGSILGFIFGVLILILAVVMLVVGKTKDPDLLQGFSEIIQNMFNGSLAKFQDAAFIYGIFLLICGICSFVSGVFCAIARNKHSLGMLITVIVLCALGGSIFGLLGAIFGLVANGQEAKQQAQPQDNQMQ